MNIISDTLISGAPALLQAVWELEKIKKVSPSPTNASYSKARRRIPDVIGFPHRARIFKLNFLEL